MISMLLDIKGALSNAIKPTFIKKNAPLLNNKDARMRKES